MTQSSGNIALFLVIMAVCFLLWAGLCRLGYASLRSPNALRGFLFALITFLFSLLGVLAKITFSITFDGNYLKPDLGWLFLVPLCLSLLGLLHAARESIA